VARLFAKQRACGSAPRKLLGRAFDTLYRGVEEVAVRK
jgi:hypothetical protein